MDGTGSDQYKRLTNQKLDSMLGLCEMASCRRQAILSYFDEEMSEPCGNCDNCLNPPETWDATIDAQKALSTVYRTGQRFGVAYLINVLLAKSDDRIVNNGHDKISTWGIGENLKNHEWSGLFRQLISQGYLNTNSEYGGIELAEKSRALLKSEITLLARKQRKPEKTSRSGKSRNIRSQLRSVDEELFEQLRALRTDLANEQGVPSYVIFSDATLIEMSNKRPQTDDTFRYINGVGEMKLQRYGEKFMDVIRGNPLPAILKNNFSNTINETLMLHNNRKT